MYYKYKIFFVSIVYINVNKYINHKIQTDNKLSNKTIYKTCKEKYTLPSHTEINKQTNKYK